MAAKVKNENYVTIQGWMINDLHLTGNELVAYAVIYGFTQADGQYMTCSQEYISNWCNISRESTNRLLKRMEGKKLIIKEMGLRCCKYRAVRPCDETSHTCDETSHTCDETSHRSDETSQMCDETAHNNYIYNNINNNTNNQIKSMNDVNDLKKHIESNLCVEVFDDDPADSALICNLTNILLSDVFIVPDNDMINVNSQKEKDLKPAFLVKNMIDKNLNYGTAKTYLNQIKEHGKRIKSKQYIIKTIYQICLSGQTMNQSAVGYERY